MYDTTNSLLCTNILFSLIIKQIGIKIAVRTIKKIDMPSIPKFIVQNKFKEVKYWNVIILGLKNTNIIVAIIKFIRLIYNPVKLTILVLCPGIKIKIKIPIKGIANK